MTNIKIQQHSVNVVFMCIYKLVTDGLGYINYIQFYIIKRWIWYCFFYSYFIRREIFVVDFFCVFVFEVCIYWIDNIYLIRIVNVGVYMCRWCQQYLWLHVRKKHIFIYFVFVYFVCTLIGFLFVFGFCSFGKHMRNKRWGKKR